ncbi:ribose-phosphate diphosphokinase [Agrilutibacter solisilvae]|uniref:Ribose-phosphate diphosphokinase n=1 Tax=Agrilutibacter solisilvae TaxID=2763317 RepID=A0A974XXX7_9GAMM|nr:ribose-phosphate diphosphokinase [Lysobacter solisilvae]QSX77774.1 ribose-phosphate diphosphokinase [Lysobacter solisilvae]
MAAVVLSFPDDICVASAVATRLGARLGRFQWRHFPDGESLVTVDEDVAGADVIVFTSLNDPDRKALPVRFAANTAREFGAASVGLVSPYLSYMRQDARFHGGEAISMNAFAQFLDQTVDWLVTVDPHLHRVSSLDAVFRMPTTCVAAAPHLADWIRTNVPMPLLIGPDAESAQWVSQVAARADAPFQVLHKTRHGDRDVEVAVPHMDRFRAHTPVLVDDIASTGRTLCAAIEHLRRLGFPPPVCVVIHAIFAPGSPESLHGAGAGRVVSTDSIAHATNAISLAGPLAEAVVARLTAGRGGVVHEP